VSAPSEDEIRAGCEALAAADGALARAYSERGLPQWRVSTCEFATLARMIAYQQVSTKAGAAIWGRVEALVGEMCAEAVLDASFEELRAAGLSGAKVKYVKAIADAAQTKALCFDRLRNAPREEAVADLVAIKGIGPWSAEIFMMTTTGDLNAFPPGDVGLMESYRLLSGADERHAPKAFTELAGSWAPYRGVATHLLWAWFNHHRDSAVAPPN